MSDTTLLDRPAAPRVAPQPTTPVLGFERTPAGQAQLQERSMALSPQAVRLLMLFEEPQTIDGLRQMIDEPWLPEALIELERRKLVRRIDMGQRSSPMAGGTVRGRPLASPRPPSPEREAAVRLARQRAQARILFLQQIGRISTLMIDRIEACQSEAELQQLTPAFAELLPPAPGTVAAPVATTAVQAPTIQASAL